MAAHLALPSALPASRIDPVPPVLPARLRFRDRFSIFSDLERFDEGYRASFLRIPFDIWKTQCRPTFSPTETEVKVQDLPEAQADSTTIEMEVEVERLPEVSVELLDVEPRHRSGIKEALLAFRQAREAVAEALPTQEEEESVHESESGSEEITDGADFDFDDRL
jgi:hypothetical protein